MNHYCLVLPGFTLYRNTIIQNICTSVICLSIQPYDFVGPELTYRGSCAVLKSKKGTPPFRDRRPRASVYSLAHGA